MTEKIELPSRRCYRAPGTGSIRKIRDKYQARGPAKAGRKTKYLGLFDKPKDADAAIEEYMREQKALAEANTNKDD